MSMHMYFQIFPPKRFGLGHDGLYRVRRWVYAIWVVFPNLSAGLAFLNPDHPYMAQGGFCSVPIRPIWYRLALFWGPRYLIWLYVVFVAVRIYVHVGKEFKVFGQERDRSDSLEIPAHSSIDRAAQAEQQRMWERRMSQRLSSIGTEQDKDDGSCAPDDVSGVGKIRQSKTLPVDMSKSPAKDVRRGSMPTWLASVNSPAESGPPASRSKSLPNSRRGSRLVTGGIISEDFAPPSNWNPGHRGSITSLGSKRPSTAPSIDGSLALPPIREDVRVSRELRRHNRSANKTMQLRREAIQRQLRLLFIYPCIYLIFWLIPLVGNIMNYNDYYAQHPIFELGVMQTVCVTVLTTADVLVFCWRERPWKHIPGSDETFLGSFMWWRICFQKGWALDRRASRAPTNVQDEDENHHSQPGLVGAVKRWSGGRKRSSLLSSEVSGAAPGSGRLKLTHKRTHSGGSDRQHLETEQAYVRLAMEQAELQQNKRSFEHRRASWVSQQGQPQSPGRKDWFDKEVGGELFVDNDQEAREKHEEV